MQFKQNDNTYFVYLEKGEPVVDVLTNFCKEHNISNGYISGIGAVNNIELGAYDSSTKEYAKRIFKETFELINYQGNIMLLDDKPFIHAHVTIGNLNMELFGGHLFSMNIAVVGEFIIQNIDSDSKRTFNPDVGFATWDLCKIK